MKWSTRRSLVNLGRSQASRIHLCWPKSLCPKEVAIHLDGKLASSLNQEALADVNKMEEPVLIVNLGKGLSLLSLSLPF